MKEAPEINFILKTRLRSACGVQLNEPARKIDAQPLVPGSEKRRRLAKSRVKKKQTK